MCATTSCVKDTGQRQMARDKTELFLTCILTLLLIFIPFQLFAYQFFKLPDYFLWIDEFIILILVFLIVLMALYKHIPLSSEVKHIGFFLSCLVFMCLISGFINHNSLFVTASGTFHYFKSFLLTPFVAWVGMREDRLRFVYKILRWLALFLCFFAFLQEAAFLFGYKASWLALTFDDVRFGLLRTPSLMGHPNTFGLYAAFFFILEMAINRRVRPCAIVFALGVLLSFSRMAWTALVVALLVLAFLRLAKKTALIVLVIMFITFAVTAPFFIEKTVQELDQYRGYILDLSLAIWRDHPLLGVGPGTFGQGVSLMVNSPLYEEYGFKELWFYEYFKRIKTSDLFWAQCLAEIGLLGAGAFVLFLFVLFRVSKSALSDCTENEFRYGLLCGLSAVPFMIFTYCFCNGLNVTSLLLTYSVLLGGALGLRDGSTVGRVSVNR